MKKLSNCINTIISRPDTEVFILIELLISQPILLTTLSYDVTMSAPGFTTRTYNADGPITSIDPPRVSKTVDREAYKISLADTDGSLRVLFDAGLVGTEVAVIMGFVNNGSTVTSSAGISVAKGDVFTDYRDTITIYRGAVDTTGITASFNESTNIAVIECSSPMGALDMRKAFFTSKDSMRNKNPTDASFDFVHQTSGASMLLWGK